MIKRYFLLHSIKFIAAIIFISASLHTLALPTSSIGGDTGNTKIPFWAVDSGGEYTGDAIDSNFVTDTSTQMADYPIYLFLPDNDPVSSARAFSFDSASMVSSTKPAVTCPGATVDSSGTYSVTITLTDGASCALTITSPSSSTTYTATLSRTGDVYSVSAGTVCGGVFICVNLPVSSTSGTEAAATAITVTATASAAVSGAQTVTVGVSGTGITAGDYTLSNTTLTIPNGSTTGTVTFTISNDTDVEGSETATIAISSPSSGITLGSTTSQNVTITDDDVALVINEIDYDNVGTDNAEFLEIKNISGSSIDLSSYSIDLFNDSTDTSYTTIALPSVNLASGDYYVICANASTVANCDLDTSPDTNLIQNGAPDAVALKQGSFIVDTISYEGNTIPSTYTETTGTTAADSNTEPFVSLSRYPDGTDTQNNNSDFALKCMTPGVANSINASSGCFVLSINDPTAVTEGNSGTTTITFTVTLSHTAASNVTVNYATANDTATAGSDYTTVSGTLTFAAGETSKTITVTVNGDQIDEGASETFKVNLTAPSNNAQLSTTVGATEGIGTITDDDTAGFTLSKTTASVHESGTTDTFTVVLNSQPTSNVVISVVSADTGEATISPATLTFTTTNWNTAQTVTVTGVDDGSVSDGNQTTTVTLSIVDASSDDLFDTLADQTVTVTTVDNDTPGITVNPTTLTVSEPSGTANFTIILNTQPSGSNDVTIPLSSSSACTISINSVTVTNANWNTGATITVTASDDNIINGGSRTCTITTGNSTSSDGNYNGVNPDDVTVTVTDNDTAGISGAQIGGSINVTEGGASGSYPIALSTQPTGDVEITVTAGTQTQVSIDGITFSNSIVLTFTNGNWNTPQTVYVKVIDDTTAGGNYTATITHAITGTVNDSNYPTTLTLGNVTVNITDNDQSDNLGSGSTPPLLPPEIKVIVAFGGSGKGKVVSNPSGIDCQTPNGCSYLFKEENSIQLTATPIGNSRFQNWSSTCRDGIVPVSVARTYCMAYFVDTTPKPEPVPVVETSPCPDANILYVNQQAAGDNHGKDWTNAFIDLQDALTLAANGTCPNVNQIWVAKGTYLPTDGTERSETFQLQNNLGIYGGFAGTEADLKERNLVNNPTLLSGDIGAVGDPSDNVYHVVTGSGTDGSAILNGFTISGGFANNGSACPEACGAGLLNVAGSPTLTHLTFHENIALNAGGGLYNSDGSAPTMLFSHVHHNSANAGGGILNLATYTTTVPMPAVEFSMTTAIPLSVIPLSTTTRRLKARECSIAMVDNPNWLTSISVKIKGLAWSMTKQYRLLATSF